MKPDAVARYWGAVNIPVGQTVSVLLLYKRESELNTNSGCRKSYIGRTMHPSLPARQPITMLALRTRLSWSMNLHLNLYSASRSPILRLARSFLRKYLSVCYPFIQTGSHLTARVSIPTSEQVNTTVEDAHAVFTSGAWSSQPAHARAAILSRLSRALSERVPDFAELETVQTGRTIREMKAQLGRLPEWL